MTSIFCRPIENPEELEQCLQIRHKVFVQEQKLFMTTDADEHDRSAVHLAAFFNNHIIGTVRVYQDSDRNWWGGRLAVLKRHRGRAGRELVLAAVRLVKKQGARQFYANIQKENLNFFKSIGWRQIGGEFQLRARAHLLIEADLK